MNLATGSLSRKWPSSISIMMPIETIGFVMEKMRKIVSCAIGAEAAGLCLPSASNQPIWPRRATITVAPGRVPLSISRLKASDMRCNRIDDSPERFRLGVGQRRRLRGDGVLGGGLRGHGLSLCSCCSGLPEVCRRTPDLNRAFGRFALAIGALPMLETARIGGDAGPYRSVAQLVEHRSPKPGVAGSSPATPASEIKYLS